MVIDVDDVIADMAMMWKYWWRGRWSQPQPIFEWTQFKVGLISAQHLLLANQIQLYTQPIYQNKSFSPKHNKQLQPKYNLIRIMFRWLDSIQTANNHQTIVENTSLTGIFSKKTSFYRLLMEHSLKLKPRWRPSRRCHQWIQLGWLSQHWTSRFWTGACSQFRNNTSAMNNITLAIEWTGKLDIAMVLYFISKCWNPKIELT